MKNQTLFCLLLNLQTYKKKYKTHSWGMYNFGGEKSHNFKKREQKLDIFLDLLHFDLFIT